MSTFRASLLIILLLWAVPVAAEPFLGIYPTGGHPHQPEAVATVQSIQRALVLSGVRLGAVGDFSSFSTAFTESQADNLNAPWNDGMIPFINLLDATPIEAFGDPASPAQVGLWELAYLYSWWCGEGPGRVVYVAPWPEMNRIWTGKEWSGGVFDYYRPSPTAYQRAFRRFDAILRAVGARACVRLVYAPSHGLDVGDYYPGARYVDAIGISSFGPGDCTAPYTGYSAETYLLPTIEVAKALPGAKPILLAQTGMPTGPQPERMAWMRHLLERVRVDPRVIGVMVFAIDGGGCNQWQFTPEQWQQLAHPLDWRLRR